MNEHRKSLCPTPLALLRGPTRDLTPFARLAGIAHQMLISGGLAARYQLPAGGDIPAERDDLRDLAWATASALAGSIPSRPIATEYGTARLFAFPSFINGALEAVEVQAAVLLVVPAGHGAPVVWVASPEELETADKLRLLSAEDGPPAAGTGGLPSETRGRIPENLVLSADESLADYIDQQGVGPGPVKLAQFRAALILRGAPALYSQDGKGDGALVCVKLFDPCGSASWYVMEWDGQEEAFGWVRGLGHDELGYFSLRELAETPGRLGIGIEIDTHFRPMALRKAQQA